jgi:hypothetical protein
LAALEIIAHIHFLGDASKRVINCGCVNLTDNVKTWHFANPLLRQILPQSYQKWKKGQSNAPLIKCPVDQNAIFA